MTITVSGDNVNIGMTPTAGQIVFDSTDTGESDGITVVGQNINIAMRNPTSCPQHSGAVNIGMITSSSICILWDMSHARFSFTGPAGTYSDLVDAMPEATFTETFDGVLVEDLSVFDVLVINAQSANITNYTTDELNEIKDFVSNGGGLLVNSDYFGAPYINIVKLVGLEFGVDSALTHSGHVYTSDFTSHQIFDGVSQVFLAAYGALSAAASPATIIATQGSPTAYPVVATSGRGSGRVVVVGDGNYCDNTYMSYADNIIFAPNILKWLAKRI